MCRNAYCPQSYRCWMGWAAHCCFPSPQPEECQNKKECFPSTAQLILENGKSVAMSELQVGDRVQTGILSILGKYFPNCQLHVIDFAKIITNETQVFSGSVIIFFILFNVL